MRTACTSAAEISCAEKGGIRRDSLDENFGRVCLDADSPLHIVRTGKSRTAEKMHRAKGKGACGVFEKRGRVESGLNFSAG